MSLFLRKFMCEKIILFILDLLMLVNTFIFVEREGSAEFEILLASFFNNTFSILKEEEVVFTT